MVPVWLHDLTLSHSHAGAPVAALTDPDPIVRQSGARAIGRLGVHASAVLRHVAELLGHRRAEVRGAAAQARENGILKIHPDTRLLPAYSYRPSLIRWTVCRAGR